jgi:hypothetical protein
MKYAAREDVGGEGDIKNVRGKKLEYKCKWKEWTSVKNDE